MTGGGSSIKNEFLYSSGRRSRSWKSTIDSDGNYKSDMNDGFEDHEDSSNLHHDFKSESSDSIVPPSASRPFTPPPQNISVDRISSMNKNQINQRDLFGRTLLHLASSAGSVRVVDALLDHHYIDTGIADYENGWTALHRAFASGNISVAQSIINHSRDSIRAKDRNNETPFETMNAIFLGNDGCLPNRQLNDIQSSRLFMFGSNANHILGFADPDNRTNPEMVKLNRYEGGDVDTNEDVDGHNSTTNHLLPRDRFKPFVIKDVKISKLHTVVLTDDPKDNLYICGIPRGGRLGLGPEKSSTQFTFTKLAGFTKSPVRAVATGLDHTVIITDSFECFTCGSNRNGQLGYPVGKTKLESAYTPRKVGGDLKRKKVIGCSASNIHTVAYTEDEVFCWGKNIGQMGFLSDLSAGGIIAPDDNSGSCIIEPSPRNMLFEATTGRIQMVCATDIATIILPAQRQEVYVFMNSIFFKVVFPIDSTLPETKNFNAYTSTNTFLNFSTISIVKIAASPNGIVCALDSLGSVYTFSLSQYFVHPSTAVGNDVSLGGSSVYSPSLVSLLRPGTLSKQVRVSAIWIGRKKHLAVQDVDIADDGSVILSTKAGSVWKSTSKRAKPDNGRRRRRTPGSGESYKFERVPFITRIRQVRCDANFGSFAAICEDVITPTLVIDKANLSDDLHFLVPFVNCDEDRATRNVLDQGQNDQQNSSYRPLEFIAKNSSLVYTESQMTPLLRDTESSYHSLNSWLTSATEEGFKLSVKNIEETDASFGYDTIIKVGKDILIPVHASILSSRSKPLRSLINGKTDKISCDTGEGEIIEILRRKSKGRLCIDMTGLELATVVILVYYLYTDYSLKPWGEFRKSVPKNILRSKQELYALKHVLKLENFWIEVYRDEQPHRNLSYNLLDMANDSQFADVVILLKDDKQYMAHSYILKSRSAYFSVLFAERWYPVRTYDSEGRQTISLQSISLEIFEIVILHIYGDKEVDIFDSIKLETAKQFVRFVLEVMSVADELLLPKLRQICECTIRQFGEYYTAASSMA